MRDPAKGGRLHICHISTSGTVDLVRAAKAMGAQVVSEKEAEEHGQQEDAPAASETNGAGNMR